MENFSLNTPLIELSGKQWTIGDAVEGVQIFGGIGSGKTSGSGRMLALKYLTAGFGGLVLTVKPDEKELWLNYCEITSRTNDLLIVEPGRENFFNFLEYESSQATDGNSLTENIVQVLKTVIKASEEKTSGKSDDSFWDTALDMLIFNVIDLCQLAYGKISIQKMYDIVQTLPKREGVTRDEETAFQEAINIARRKIKAVTVDWEEKLTVEELRELNSRATYENAVFNDEPEARLFKFIDNFFYDSYMNLNERTRSIIDFSFSGFLFRLLRDPVYSLFCHHASTFTPEMCLDGKIILINLPVKTYHKIGRDSQIMFKYIWQRAMEKRQVKKDGTSRPVFLWADEAQNFLHEHDPDYQATARSSMIATVYISQNLPNYLANMSGTKSDHKVNSFLGTLGTKIFHANADIETNKYSSELIGDGYFEETSKSSTIAGQFTSGRNRSLKIDRIVRPEDFVRLKTGGNKNKGCVEAYLHQQGNVFGENGSHIKVKFSQTYTP